MYHFRFLSVKSRNPCRALFLGNTAVKTSFKSANCKEIVLKTWKQEDSKNHAAKVFIITTFFSLSHTQISYLAKEKLQNIKYWNELNFVQSYLG